MHSEDELPPNLTPLLMVRRIVVIDVDQGLLLVSLSHMKRNTTVNVDTRARLTEAWEITLWVKHWTRFPSRPSCTRLKGQYFLGGSISQHSPSTMVEWTLWRAWATSIRMAVHSKDEALMCKLFPSSLEHVAMRWFDGLRADFIDSFKELTGAFGSHFTTDSRVPRPLDSLLSLSVREGETLKTYSDRYWEMFNEIDSDFDDVVISTFKVGLLVKHDLRKSLTGKLVTSVR